MEDNARKYILNVGSIISCGLSACTTFEEYNVLDAFTVTTGGTTCSFSCLSLNELKNISLPEYDNRINHFFEYIGLEECTLKNNLLTGATFYNPDCDIVCKLNPNFLVYRFLDGVRIVNVGEANGEVEYIAYPMNDDPSGYTWQTNGTFLGLDLSKTYVFKIRDNLNSDIICEYQQQISLPLLLPSTTVTLTPVEISLNETVRNCSLDLCYSYSEVISTPNLTSGQRVSVCYETDMYYFGSGSSYLALYCQRPIDSGYVEYTCYTSSGVGSFEMNDTTDWCFRIVADAPIAGASANVDFCLNSVNGLGTTIPSIDAGNCSLSISNCAQPIDVTASTNCVSSTNPSSGVYYEDGCIDFNQPIPEGNCMILQMSATTNVVGSADACITFFCKPNGSSNPPVQINKTSGSNTCTPTITARYGDEITYNITTAAADLGTAADGKFCIDFASGSYGVNTYISSNNCRSLSASTPSLPVVVSVCRQCNTTTTPLSSCAIMNGYINTSFVGNGQCVGVDVCIDVTRPHGLGELWISCQPSGCLDYFVIASRTTTGGEIVNFEMCQGDVVCYCATLDGIPLENDETGNAYLCLDNVVGYNGVSASINSCVAKQSDNIDVFVEGTGGGPLI